MPENATTFHCTIVTPEQQLLDESISYASIPAWDGQLGLLDRRAPMLVKLGYGRLRLQMSDGSRRDYFVGGGFVQMKHDRLTILTDEARARDQIDAEEARAALKEAQARRAAGEEEIARREREESRARAMLELAG
jgi:F-type H+-transporting ATPase subunit epsilon